MHKKVSAVVYDSNRDKEYEPQTKVEIKQSVEKLYKCCEENPDLEFLLTKVGCGIAGFAEDYMRQQFLNPPKNLILPEDWR